MRKLLTFACLLIPAFCSADRLGSLRSNAEVMLSSQAAPMTPGASYYAQINPPSQQSGAINVVSGMIGDLTVSTLTISNIDVDTITYTNTLDSINQVTNLLYARTIASPGPGVCYQHNLFNELEPTNGSDIAKFYFYFSGGSGGCGTASQRFGLSDYFGNEFATFDTLYSTASFAYNVHVGSLTVGNVKSASCIGTDASGNVQEGTCGGSSPTSSTSTVIAGVGLNQTFSGSSTTLNVNISSVTAGLANRADVATATGTLQTNINLVGVTTGTLQTNLNLTAVTTGTINTRVNSVGQSTGTLLTSIVNLGQSTGTINGIVSGHTTSIANLGQSTGTLLNSVVAIGQATGTLSGVGGGGYSVEPATVTFNLAKGVIGTTATFTGNISGGSLTLTGSGNTSITEPNGISGQIVLSTAAVVAGHLAVWGTSVTIVDGGAVPTGGGGTSTLGVNYNGASITSPTVQINFIGPGVSVAATGSTSTVTISSWPAGTGSPAGPADSVQTSSGGVLGGYDNFKNNGTTVTVTGVYTKVETSVSTDSYSGAYLDYWDNTMTVGRVISSGTVPTLTFCGTAPAIVGNDNSFTFTVGTSTGSCNVSFATAYTNVPVCTPVQRTPSATNMMGYVVTTSSISFTRTTFDSQKVDVHCQGRF